MRLTDYLKLANIKVPLVSTTKVDCIRELVDLLYTNKELVDPKKVVEAVLEREATRTTGIGYGLAIPHGKTVGTEHLVMAVGKPAQPIDFAAMDGKPVGIIWLLTSPPDKTGLHISMLARISRMMMADRFRADLLKATTAEEIMRIVATQEEA